MNYKKITAPKLFEGVDAFCDENGVQSNELPAMNWKVQFKSSTNGTLVEIDIKYASQKDLETVVQMGFEEGFSAAHQNLDKLLGVRV